jgi:hypothetical protein
MNDLRASMAVGALRIARPDLHEAAERIANQIVETKINHPFDNLLPGLRLGLEIVINTAGRLDTPMSTIFQGYLFEAYDWRGLADKFDPDHC